MVFSPDKRRKPLASGSDKQAGPSSGGRACINKRLPFTIRLLDRLAGNSAVRLLSRKFNPGGQTAGAVLFLLPDDSPEPSVKAVSLLESGHLHQTRA
ncbi:MAG: RRXRR domain-containing protein [Deltaproteobacteria bacterium]|nr:RRXRR domain-containing protein [Deltaproteobacteria bacterium]